MASVESQTPSVKLSLEKYAGTVSVLGQGGDAASLVSDMSTLKEVAKLNGLEGRTKSTKTELLQILCASRLASPYIGLQNGACSNTDVHNGNCASNVPDLLPNDLIGLRWAVPSQALANGVAAAPTLLDFARRTLHRDPENQIPIPPSTAPARQSVEIQASLHVARGTQPAGIQSIGQATVPHRVHETTSNRIRQHFQADPMYSSVAASQGPGLHQVASQKATLPFPSHAHDQPQQAHKDIPMHAGGTNCGGSKHFASQKFSDSRTQDLAALQQSQQMVQNIPSKRGLNLSQQIPITSAPSAVPTPGGAVQNCVIPAAPPPPTWLLQDIVEIARSSSVVAVRPGTCILKQRVAICFPEDQELSVPRRGSTIIRQGVYDGKVLESIVEVCVDMPSQLQLGSFTAFAHSEEVEDSWVLLSAGQSPELAALSDVLDKMSQPSLEQKGTSKKQPKSMTKTLAPKHPKPVMDLRKLSTSEPKPPPQPPPSTQIATQAQATLQPNPLQPLLNAEVSTQPQAALQSKPLQAQHGAKITTQPRVTLPPKPLQPPPSAQIAAQSLATLQPAQNQLHDQKHAQQALSTAQNVEQPMPRISSGQGTVAMPSVTKAIELPAASNDVAVVHAKQQARLVSVLPTAPSAVKELAASTACMAVTGVTGSVGDLQSADVQQAILNNSISHVNMQPQSAEPKAYMEKLHVRGELPAVPVNPSQPKIGNGWKKRKRPGAEC